MKAKRHCGLWTAALGLALTSLSGCQTWFGGMTLPSGRYLQHPPQYFPPSPVFPLQRELASQEAIAAQAGGAALAPPAPVPPAPVVPPPGALLPAPQPQAQPAPAPGGAPMAQPMPEK